MIMYIHFRMMLIKIHFKQMIPESIVVRSTIYKNGNSYRLQSFLPEFNEELRQKQNGN